MALNITFQAICCSLLLVLSSGFNQIPDSPRVRRQAQSVLSVLSQNPSLVQQLQQNPEFLQLLQSQLQQQQQSFGSLPTPLSLVGNIPLVSTTESSGECASLRKQNKLLRQMLLSVAGDDHPELLVGSNHNPRDLLLAATSNSAQALLEKAVGGGAIQSLDQLVTSMLVTPTPTWTTEESTTTYVTTVTETASTEVPIILRGNKVITTILEEQTKVVTATEIQTSSSLITPSPTWSTFLISQTPTPINLLSDTFGNLETDSNPSHENARPKKRTNVVQAKVIELEDQTPRPSKLDRFKEAYGAYFASSAQRSAQRFGDSFKRGSGSFEDDESDIFDQQSQPDQQRPVYVPNPNPPSHKEFTLYFSGKAPGEFTTRVTLLPVDSQGKPITRSKREDIHPSKVEPILQTVLQEGLHGSQQLEELEGSIEKCQPSTATVTVTQTVTSTVTAA